MSTQPGVEVRCAIIIGLLESRFLSFILNILNGLSILIVKFLVDDAIKSIAPDVRKILKTRYGFITWYELEANSQANNVLKRLLFYSGIKSYFIHFCVTV